jgi:hypothetical protein
MSSTRKLGLMTLAVGAMMLCGCQQANEDAKAQIDAFHIVKRVPPPEPMNETVILGDPALGLRQWDPSACFYINDAVVAGPTYAPIKVGAMDYWLNAPVEQILFLVDLLYIPPGVFIEYPWSNEVYKSFTAQPSYTLMPPLPQGPAQVPTSTYY